MTSRWISFDVGIKNLAYCILDINRDISSISIKMWDVISLLNEPQDSDLESHKRAVSKKEKNKNSNKNSNNRTSLIHIGIQIKKHFDHLDMNSMKIDGVIIENQIAPIASNMKSIQCMIMQYFIMNSVENVNFIPATSKMKYITTNIPNDFDNLYRPLFLKKLNYKERKAIGVKACRYALQQHENELCSKWLSMLDSHKKKDDLSDAYLQALAFFVC